MKSKAEVMKDLAKVRRRKIVIQKKTEGFDEWENPVEAWVDWKTVWAERESLWGKEYFAARAVGEEGTIEFVIRHVGFLDELDTVNYRIVLESSHHDFVSDGGGLISAIQPVLLQKRVDRTRRVEYDIKHIDRLTDDGMWVKLRCLERDDDGKDG